MPVSKPSRPKSKARREALMAEAEVARIAPLDYMLDVLNAPRPVREIKEPIESYRDRLSLWEERRMDAAKAAAPYVHAKPLSEVKIAATVEVEEKPINVLELAKRVAFIFAMSQARPELDVTPHRIN